MFVVQRDLDLQGSLSTMVKISTALKHAMFQEVLGLSAAGRYPHLTGRALQDEIESTYVLAGSCSVSVPVVCSRAMSYVVVCVCLCVYVL